MRWLLKSKIEARIQNLLSEEFEDGVTTVTTSLLTAPVGAVFIVNIYNNIDSTFGDQYICCYDTLFTYSVSRMNALLKMHAPHAVLYTYYKDLKSVYYLQTIPTDKKVILYSRSGHQSAFATAYLRLLGYTNVRSMLFGAIWLDPFPGSMNYPYVN